jgi:streptogramin lyase
MTGLLNAHYAVFAMNMPNSAPGANNCGDTSIHVTLFSTYGDSAMQLFVDPAVQAMNYWDAHGGHGYYGMMGLSGGGWTTNAVAAVDTRVLVAVSVAGWLPGIVFNGTSPTGCGVGAPDTEQQAVDYFTIAGYLDQALMGASGVGRAYLQILNVNDNCCFGPTQFSTCATQYGESWYAYTASYFRQVQSYSLVPASFNFVADYCANQHQISSCALAQAIAEFNAYLVKPPVSVRLRR